MLDLSTLEIAAQLGVQCVRSKIIVSGAESCTGGLIAAAITSVSGSSAWFDRGFITYSNEAKMQMLGVNAKTLEVFGAVSEQTAGEMAHGVLANSRATMAFSVTGVAGPTGGTTTKPVGMVCFGFAAADDVAVTTQYFKGDRVAVRAQSVLFVLKRLQSIILGF
jgi:nicotinamide-nucleotide amidase